MHYEVFNYVTGETVGYADTLREVFEWLGNINGPFDYLHWADDEAHEFNRKLAKGN